MVAVILVSVKLVQLRIRCNCIDAKVRSCSNISLHIFSSKYETKYIQTFIFFNTKVSGNLLTLQLTKKLLPRHPNILCGMHAQIIYSELYYTWLLT